MGRVVTMNLREGQAVAKAGKDGVAAWMRGVKEGLAGCLALGGVYCMNLDEGLSQELLAPCLGQFYHPYYLPAEVLRLSELRVEAVFKQVLKGTVHEGVSGIHPEFRV